MKPVDALQQALAALTGVDLAARALAIEIVARHRHAPAVPRMIALLETADPGTRYLIIKAFGPIGDPAAIPALLEALRGDDMFTRAAAAGSLIQIGATAIEGLVIALRDDRAVTRRAAAKALGKIPESGSHAPVLEALAAVLDDEDAGVRQFAAEAIGRLESAMMIDALISMLRDANAGVRQAAARSLAAFDTPAARAALRELGIGD